MSILNSGSAKQKLNLVHSNISGFWKSSNNPRSDKPETIYALPHILNEETIKCKKDLFLPLRIQRACQIFLQKRIQM